MATDEICVQVLDSLKDGPYACLSLEKLSGGTANFVYRGTLKTPLQGGVRTVVVKHTEGYVASNPGFKLAESRSVSWTFWPSIEGFPSHMMSKLLGRTLPRMITELHPET